MEIVEGEFPVGKKDQWCHAGQETLCEKFPVWHEAVAFQQSRKPFVKSFPFGMKPQRFSRVGNSLRIVSCLA